MSSGMNTEQAKEYAKTMTYRQAVGNVGSGKFIKYRKATLIKLRELAEIADWLDAKQTEPYEDEFDVCDSRNGCYWCEYHICKLEREEKEPMMTKTYTLPDGTEVAFEYNHNMVGAITLECMDILMSLLKATAKQTEPSGCWVKDNQGEQICDNCIKSTDCSWK